MASAARLFQGAPVTFKGQHFLNLLLALVMIGCGAAFAVTRGGLTLLLAAGVGPARALGRAAGLATGDYLLAHRIPAVARALLPRLPAGLAARLLLAAHLPGDGGINEPPTPR